MDQIFSIPDTAHIIRTAARLFAAAVLGGLIGLEREWMGKVAARRHARRDGKQQRYRQHLARHPGHYAGIGFIGAGTILKRTNDEDDIKGLTTAATIWLTAAVGAAAGAGHGWFGLIGALIAFLILSILSGVDTWLARRRGNHPTA